MKPFLLCAELVLTDTPGKMYESLGERLPTISFPHDKQGFYRYVFMGLVDRTVKRGGIVR